MAIEEIFCGEVSIEIKEQKVAAAHTCPICTKGFYHSIDPRSSYYHFHDKICPECIVKIRIVLGIEITNNPS